MRNFPMRYTRGAGRAFCYNGRHPSLEWFQVISNGKSQTMGFRLTIWLPTP